jgi:uridine kinase
LIESPLLVEHVATLSRGEAIERPLYDFSRHIRVPDRTQTIEPGAFVLVEGLFALFYVDLLPLYQLRVFIDTPDDVCFDRRMRRDTVERGRSAESVRIQYETTVRPSSFAFVRPSAANADLVIDGTAALDWKVEQALSKMRERGLLRLPR